MHKVACLDALPLALLDPKTSLRHRSFRCSTRSCERPTSRPLAMLSTSGCCSRRPNKLKPVLQDGGGASKHLVQLQALDFLVLDEADRMVQQGHYQVGF